MRSKKINYRNGATGLTGSKQQLQPVRIPITASENKNNIASYAVAGPDTKAAISPKSATTPATPATPKAVPVDTPEVPIVGQEVPSVMVGSGSSSSITTEQPEKTVKKDYTRLILQVVIAAFAIHWLRTNLK